VKSLLLLPRLVQDDKAKKRKRDDGWDSNDSDFDDLRGFERSGLALAVKDSKSLALAPSIAASLGGKTLGAKSAGAASRGARSEGGRSLQSHGQRSAKHQKGSQHSGDRFKSKKKGTGAWARPTSIASGTAGATLSLRTFCSILLPEHLFALCAGGDTKGSAKVEPYAYWPLDKRLMNRRQQKSKGAKEGLDKIVVAAREGAARGNKAKRQRQQQK
jgi:ribosomal RNA-processing protein 12